MTIYQMQDTEALMGRNEKTAHIQSERHPLLALRNP